MKTFLIFGLSCSIFLFACKSSSNELAHNGVKMYLQKTMNDYSSYQPIEFGKLDTATWYDSPTYYVDSIILSSAMRDMESIGSTVKIEMKFLTAYNSDDLKRDAADLLKKCKIAQNALNVLHQDSVQFKPTEFKIEHKFRGKNAYGAFVVNNKTFILDSTYTVKRSQD